MKDKKPYEYEASVTISVVYSHEDDIATDTDDGEARVREEMAKVIRKHWTEGLLLSDGKWSPIIKY